MLTTEFDMKRAQAVWRQEALEEGIEKAARGMIGENLPLEQVARITGLSIERVRELAHGSSHGHADTPNPGPTPIACAGFPADE